MERLGMRIEAALSDKALHRGVEACGLCSVAFAAKDIVDLVVGAVPFLVKGHGGADQHTVCGSLDAVEHGGHIAVIPDVVRAPAVDGERANGVSCWG